MRVIPTMLLVGLVLGRWWAIPLGGVVWALLVVLAVSITPAEVPLAAALGAANVAVGVLVRWAVVCGPRGWRCASRGLRELLDADQAADDLKERLVDVIAAFPADPEPAVLVQPGDRPLHDPALFPEP